jgi:hypothetical protein
MSLTSELDNRNSPIREYVRFVGAVLAGAERGGPLVNACNQILGFKALEVETAIPPGEDANPRSVGTAFDYRLRYHLGECPTQALVAWHGAAVHLANPYERAEAARFFGHLELLTSRISPAGRELSDEDELLLDSYCVVLQQFEAMYRTAGQWHPVFPLPTSGDMTPETEPLLQLAPEADVQDVMRLSRSVPRVFGPLIEPVLRGALPYDANPKFAGSMAIGGADADFIIGGTIFELKTLKALNAPALRNALLQLIGYALLDYDDTYRIRNVGLYLSRQEWVAAWPVWQFVFPLSEVVQRLAAGTEPGGG